MKLVEFINDYGREIYVNPDNVTHLVAYDDNYTIINFNTSNSHKQDFVHVRGNVKDIIKKLREEM